MKYAVDTESRGYLPDGHFDKSVDPFGRPHRWSEGEGHFPIEMAGTPEGVVGKATHGEARKAMRPLAAILRYLTLVNDEILQGLPVGQTAADRRGHAAHAGGDGTLPPRADEPRVAVGLRAAAHRAGYAGRISRVRSEAWRNSLIGLAIALA